VVVDLEGLADRVEALPVPAGNYRQLAASPTELLYLDAPSGDFNRFDFRTPPARTLAAYSWPRRTTRTLAEGVDDYDLYRCADAEVLLVACNTPARMAKGAVRALRDEGIAAGLFRPQTIWPFPIRALLPLLEHVRRVVVVEASEGQLEDELRLALSHAGAGQGLDLRHVRRMGGVLPSQREIVDGVRAALPRRARA
jgi:pyruvate/2-oxoacid:ferredoxin oxidoreductase alpha subunit